MPETPKIGTCHKCGAPIIDTVYDRMGNVKTQLCQTGHEYLKSGSDWIFIGYWGKPEDETQAIITPGVATA